MRPCHSGAPFHWPLRSLSQQAFLEAHVAAFERFGGVFEVVRYDNLAQAVRKVLRGRSRLESDRFLLLRSHYRFTAVFCQPGLRGAHENGGVEGEFGYFRRNHLVPVPEVGDWAHLIDHCQFAARDELNPHLDGRVRSVGEAWALERLKRLTHGAPAGAALDPASTAPAGRKWIQRPSDGPDRSENSLFHMAGERVSGFTT